MVTTVQGPEADKDKILLGLLESVERNGGQSQRHLASELGPTRKWPGESVDLPGRKKGPY